MSNPTIEGGGDVTNMSPGEDGNDRKATPLRDRLDSITVRMNCVRGKLAQQVGEYVFPSPEGAVLMASPPETGDGNQKSPSPSIVGLLITSVQESAMPLLLVWSKGVTGTF